MATFNSLRATEAFAQLAEVLEGAGAPIRRGSMMGRPILKIGSTMFACLSLDKAGFKLGAGTPAHGAALKVRKAGLFDPGGKGRVFKGWVGIPQSEAKTWAKFAELAIAHAMEAQGGTTKRRAANGEAGEVAIRSRTASVRRGADVKLASAKAASSRGSTPLASAKKRGRAARAVGATTEAHAPTRPGKGSSMKAPAQRRRGAR